MLRLGIGIFAVLPVQAHTKGWMGTKDYSYQAKFNTGKKAKEGADELYMQYIFCGSGWKELEWGGKVIPDCWRGKFKRVMVRSYKRVVFFTKQ